VNEDEYARRLSELEKLMNAKFEGVRTSMDAQAEKVALALAASDKAVTKAEIATEKRFESVNEFRAQLQDQTRTFVAREEANVLFKAMQDKLDLIQDQMKSGQIWQGNITGRLAVGGIALTVVMAFVVFLANYLTSK
jgi:hypothetical protein